MLHILIVDDQPYLCELFQHELLEDNCHIIGTGNTESIKRYLEDSMPDIVLIEISLHGFEGWDVLHYIKIKYPDLPVLIVTSYDNYPDDPRTYEADGYLVKDFMHLNVLKEKITNILALREKPKVPYPIIEGKAMLPLYKNNPQLAIT
jgi:DNA-binding NarL/FixJ family response regulator